jgi:hypothetical protein
MLKPFPKATAAAIHPAIRRGKVVQSPTATGADAAAADSAAAAGASGASSGFGTTAATAALSTELSQVAYSVKRLGNVYGVQCAAAAAQLQVL